jgi:cell wall-associated NlpC family hydrolase
MQHEKITQLIELARSLKGAPYKYGAYAEPASNTQTAFDCSSFIQFIFHNFGVELPRSTILQAAAEGMEITSLADARPGDVLFFEGEVGHYRHELFPGRKLYIGHVGIYTGDNKMVHATNSNGFSGVVEHNLKPTTNPTYNKETILLIKRYL